MTETVHLRISGQILLVTGLQRTAARGSQGVKQHAFSMQPQIKDRAAATQVHVKDGERARSLARSPSMTLLTRLLARSPLLRDQLAPSKQQPKMEVLSAVH